MHIELDEDVVVVLEELRRPVKETVRELMVLGLYRLGELSSGKAAQLLGVERADFIRHASALGIPYFQLSGDELRFLRLGSACRNPLPRRQRTWHVGA